MSDLTLKPGKYTLRNGRKAVVRYVETELDVPESTRAVGRYKCDGTLWIAISWHANGRYYTNQKDSDLDIVAEGWPIECVHGKWYRTNQGDVGRLERLPDWYEPEMNRRWLIRYRCGCGYLSDANDGKVKLFKEVPEPEWAK